MKLSDRIRRANEMHESPDKELRDEWYGLALELEKLAEANGAGAIAGVVEEIELRADWSSHGSIEIKEELLRHWTTELRAAMEQGGDPVTMTIGAETGTVSRDEQGGLIVTTAPEPADGELLPLQARRDGVPRCSECSECSGGTPRGCTHAQFDLLFDAVGELQSLPRRSDAVGEAERWLRDLAYHMIGGNQGARKTGEEARALADKLAGSATSSTCKHRDECGNGRLYEQVREALGCTANDSTLQMIRVLQDGATTGPHPESKNPCDGCQGRTGITTCVGDPNRTATQCEIHGGNAEPCEEGRAYYQLEDDGATTEHPDVMTTEFFEQALADKNQVIEALKAKVRGLEVQVEPHPDAGEIIEQMDAWESTIVGNSGTLTKSELRYWKNSIRRLQPEPVTPPSVTVVRNPGSPPYVFAKRTDADAYIAETKARGQKERRILGHCIVRGVVEPKPAQSVAEVVGKGCLSRRDGCPSFPCCFHPGSIACEDHHDKLSRATQVPDHVFVVMPDYSKTGELTVWANAKLAAADDSERESVPGLWLPVHGAEQTAKEMQEKLAEGVQLGRSEAAPEIGRLRRERDALQKELEKAENEVVRWAREAINLGYHAGKPLAPHPAPRKAGPQAKEASPPPYVYITIPRGSKAIPTVYGAPSLVDTDRYYQWARVPVLDMPA